MRVTRKVDEFARWSEVYRRAGLSVGFVPTLGALHEGHLALMERARQECERVSVSIYLNPTQFDSRRDLETYPAVETKDLEICLQAGVDLVLLGSSADLFPENFQSWVEVQGLTERLCGAVREGHFRGVTTVVTQLLHIARPHRAYFGLKDFQQARTIEKLASDLVFGTEICTVPTVRAADGLAISSRNHRLEPADRYAATGLYRALVAVREVIEAGEDRSVQLESELRRRLEDTGFRVDYAEILDGRLLEPFPGGRVHRRDGGILIAVAVYRGAVRLIDNIWLPPVPGGPVGPGTG